MRVTAASRYEALSSRRSSYLERGRSCAKLTIPSLLPDDDSGTKGSDSVFKTPFQGVGADGVSTLAARTLLTLFPPNMPMFRMQMNDAELREAREAASQEVNGAAQQQAWETELQTGLSKYEQAVQAEIEACGDRASIHEALLHLFVVGNVLLVDNKDMGKGVRTFPLTRFVLNRDPMGTWIELVTHEKVALVSLPPETQQRVREAMNATGDEDGPAAQNDETFLDLYTHVRRVKDGYEAYQECTGHIIAGSEATYPIGGCPYIPLRMYWVAGEDYGRSYVENFLGDLKSLEALTQAIIEGSAIAAKVVFLVQPNGTTKASDLAKAPNGGFATGNVADVGTLQVQKAADMRVALETIQMLTGRLSKAFMLMDGMRRDAERVTAEEIRALASEIEAGNGGMYSMLTQELQLPYIRRRIHKMTKANKLPSLPEGVVEPSIVTGFEALGRGNDKSKLVSFITTVAQTIGPEAMQQFLNVSDFLSRLAAADGINTEGLIKSAEQLQQEQQQAQQMQAMNSLGPKAMDMVGKLSQQQQPQEAALPPDMAGQGV